MKLLFEERAAIEKALYQKEIDEIASMKRQSFTKMPSQQDTKEPIALSDHSESFDSELADPSERSEQSIVKSLMLRNEELRKSAQKTADQEPQSQMSLLKMQPRYFESTETPRGASLKQSLFEPVPDDFRPEPLAANDNLLGCLETAMRIRPQQWQSNGDHQDNPEQADLWQYRSHGSWDGPTRVAPPIGRQQRRNSTSFYPIDDDEKVDIIQLNDSFRENEPEELPSDDGMDEEESDMNAMLACYGSNDESQPKVAFV